jgi:hypothetical protein
VKALQFPKGGWWVKTKGGGEAMEKQIIQEQELLEKVEDLFWKLWSGEELNQEDLELLKDPQFRKELSWRIKRYPHDWV